MSVWTFAEEKTPPEAEPVRDLWTWGLNFDERSHAGNPWLLFLDLIGWSQDEYGVRVSSWEGHSLGWLEIEYLTDALMAYTRRPEIVRAWVNGLMASEMEPD